MMNARTFWPDVAITLFALDAGFLYFGGYFWPQSIGSETGIGSLLYLLMVILAVGYGLMGHLAHPRGAVDGKK